MRARGFFEFGGPEVLQVLDLPEDQPGAGQVRVRVHAATVNPTDTMLRNGSRAQALQGIQPPHVPGMDVAGVIDAIGPDTQTDLAIGDAVMAMVDNQGSHGGYRESIVLSADAVAPIPEGVSMVQAATLPMNGLTARQTLDALALQAGQTLAVTGAAGCFGGYVIQLAKQAGLRVIADAGPGDQALVRSFGADTVVPRGDDIAAQIRKVVPQGVDGLADCSYQRDLAFGAVRDGGGFAAVRGWSMQERGVACHVISVRRYNHRADLLRQLRQDVHSGVITLRVAATYAPEQASEAHRRLEAGGTRGRLVIVF
jgi:NADPH:quinone reductase-like Zn-dependent oxidoreductase